MQSGVTNALHGAEHRRRRTRPVRAVNVRGLQRGLLSARCASPPRSARRSRVGSAADGATCTSKSYNPRPERLARRTAPPSIARRDCRTLPRNSRATAAGYRHSPRNRLTRSGPRLKSTRSGSVTGNFTCELFRGSGRRWPYRSSEAARRRPIGWGAATGGWRHCPGPGSGATVSFRRRRVRTTGTGLGTRADHLADNDEDS